MEHETEGSVAGSAAPPPGPVLTLRQFRFRMRATGPAALPDFSGSTLRGAFGHAFRRVACPARRTDCTGCPLRRMCAYAYVFETPWPATAGPAAAGGDRAPHPFILCPPWDGPQQFEAGDFFSFHVVLIGRGVEFFPLFVEAIQEMGRQGIGQGRGRFALHEVVEHRPGGGVERFDGRRLAPEPAGDPLGWSPEGHPFPVLSELVVQLVTPAKLQARRELLADFDFPLFFRGVLRRIKMLAIFHCDNGTDWDWRPLAERAAEVADRGRDLRPQTHIRWSQRQRGYVPLQGVVGYLRIGGRLDPFLPYLAIGQLIHVGKATAFGFGRYQLNPDFTSDWRPRP